MRHLDTNERVIAAQLVSSQTRVVERFLSDPNALSVELVAELGLSIETLVSLQEFVEKLEDWQLEYMSRIVQRGELNVGQVRYVVGPVAARMAELEGPKLGGFYSEVIIQWLSGLPLTSVKARAQYENRIEDLISIIYSRIHYLLPWGLYAVHRMVEKETEERSISSYYGEILSLAYLVDAGVPNFDALRLVGLEFERVDATRLSQEYAKRKPYVDTDIIGWVANEDSYVIEECVRGNDNRRSDFDFARLISELRS